MSELNEFGRLLVSVVSIYLVYYFAHILYVKGRKWVLAKYLIAGILIFGSVAAQSWYAWLIRHMAPEAVEFHPGLDGWRDLVNFLYCIPFLIGAYIYESETREIKSHVKMTLIYTALVIVSALAVWL